MVENGRPRPLTTSRPALLNDGSDGAFREMVSDLVAFSGRLQEIREVIARAIGITPPQYTIVMTLSKLGSDLTVTDLADHLRVSVPFIVTETRRLEDLGLLEKRGDPVDRRRVRLVLTEQAMTVLADIAPLQVRVNDTLYRTLGARDLKTVGRVARDLLGSCDAALEQARAGQPPQR